MHAASQRPLIPLNPQKSDLRYKFSRKVKKNSKKVKNQKVDYSEDHNFLCSKKLGVAAYAEEFF